MTGTMRIRSVVRIIVAVILNLTFIFQAGCKAPEKDHTTYTVGILSRSPNDAQLFVGFLEGMTEKGFIENKNIKYLFDQLTSVDDENIDAGIERLLAQDIDLLITTGNKVALRAKQLFKGTDMPVIFSSDPWPVENGIIESLRHPGGNLTGIRFPDTAPKLLEILQSIDPGLSKVFIPYNPDDDVSIDQLPKLNQAARQLGIEIVFQEIHSVEEALTAIEGLPEDIDAIFIITAPTLNPGRFELSQAANKRGLMSGSILHDDAVLLSLSPDAFNAGEKTANIVHQIFLGNKPGDMPVETSEVILTVNIKTAEQIGIAIPEVVLAQATKVVR